MKIARFFALVFACLGVFLLAGSMGFILLSRNAQVQVAELPQEAVSCCDAFTQALDAGDLETAAGMMYGQPDLGVGGLPEDPESALLWEAFLSSIAVELTGTWEVEQSTLVRTARITHLDVSTVTGTLPDRVQALIDQRIASAADLTEIYDEQNDFREELVEAVLREALQQSMTQDGKTLTREVTLKLVNRDGRWWIAPDQNLLQILTGLA